MILRNNFSAVSNIDDDDQVSISSTFFKQLLHSQIPKLQKNKVKLSVFFLVSGYLCTKAACKMLMKLTTGINFINILQAAFTIPDPERAKK